MQFETCCSSTIWTTRLPPHFKLEMPKKIKNWKKNTTTTITGHLWKGKDRIMRVFFFPFPPHDRGVRKRLCSALISVLHFVFLQTTCWAFPTKSPLPSKETCPLCKQQVCLLWVTFYTFLVHFSWTWKICREPQPLRSCNQDFQSMTICFLCLGLHRSHLRVIREFNGHFVF